VDLLLRRIEVRPVGWPSATPRFATSTWRAGPQWRSPGWPVWRTVMTWP